MDAMSDDFRKRCAAFLSSANQRAIMRVGDPVQELMEFVIAESGKLAAPELKDALPLCLYFHTEADRDEFTAAMAEAKPNMLSRKALP